MRKSLYAAALLVVSTPLMAQTFVYVSEADDGTVARYALNEQTAHCNCSTIPPLVAKLCQWHSVPTVTCYTRQSVAHRLS
ncbi:hypothetical protein ACFFW8_07250 [Erwinia tracheiphila]